MHHSLISQAWKTNQILTLIILIEAIMRHTWWSGEYKYWWWWTLHGQTVACYKIWFPVMWDLTGHDGIYNWQHRILSCQLSPRPVAEIRDRRQRSVCICINYHHKAASHNITRERDSFDREISSWMCVQQFTIRHEYTLYTGRPWAIELETKVHTPHEGL